MLPPYVHQLIESWGARYWFNDVHGTRATGCNLARNSPKYNGEWRNQLGASGKPEFTDIKALWTVNNWPFMVDIVRSQIGFRLTYSDRVTPGRHGLATSVRETQDTQEV